MNVGIVNEFLDHPAVAAVLPASVPYEVTCRCLPQMNVRAPGVPFTDRVVMCGDAGSTRLFKDGLGAAYLMGKAAAKTAVFHGVSADHFRREYLPVYRSIVNDNRYGKILFQATDLFKKYRTLTRGMLKVVSREQEDQYRFQKTEFGSLGHVYRKRTVQGYFFQDAQFPPAEGSPL